MIDYEIKEMIQVICIYYAKLNSDDDRRKKIMSKYRELELLTDINSNTIRQWTDSLDPYFDNGRKGYYQRNIEESNKDLYSVYQQYKNKSIEDMEKIVSDFYKVIRGNSNNEMIIDDKKVSLYSVKTRDREIVSNILSEAKSFQINRLNWYEKDIKEDDIIFLVLGGDKQPWNNGLIALSKIIKVIPSDDSSKNFSIDVNLLLKFPVELTPEDFYYYPNVKNVINIGPALKGTPNQAINKVPYSGAISVLGAIIDIFPELELSISKLIGSKNMNEILNIPRLQTKGEIEKKIIDDELNIDFEGSGDLIDYTGLSDEEISVVKNGNLDEDETIRKELMAQSSALQKNKLLINREPLSIYDLYRRYTRFQDYFKTTENVNMRDLEDSLVLEPDFQRGFVWNRKKKIELIESILLGIPLPTFYFSQDINGNYLVVDGKQRLKAIFDYITENEYLSSEYSFLTKDQKNRNKIFFSDLQSKIQRKIEDFSLNCYVVGANTPALIQNEIFIRVNRGGVPLNQQEIRNASNVGMVTLELLNRISKNEDFSVVPITRRKDQYLALRFFAVYIVLNDKEFNSIYSFEDHYENMDNFLDFVMKYINNTNRSYVDNLYDIYISNLSKAFEVFDNGGLKRFTRSGSKTVNMVIFETWLNILSIFPKNIVSENNTLFGDIYNSMVNDDKFLENIISLRDKKEKIIERFSMIKEYQTILERKVKNYD